LVALHADVGQQVEVLHEIAPVIFIGVVTSLILHQIALLVQFRQCSVLGFSFGHNFGQNLHFLLIFSKLELVGVQILVHAVLAGRFLLHVRLVETVENCHLVLRDCSFLTEAQPGEEIEVSRIGVVFVEVAYQAFNIGLLDLLEGEIVSIQKLLDAAVDRPVGFFHYVEQIFVHVLADAQLHEVVVRCHRLEQLVAQLVNRPHLAVF
jgi:hypothetical protein